MNAEQFRTAMRTLGLTYHTAAEALHMGKWGFQSVGKWARGEKPIPPHFAALIAKLLESGELPTHFIKGQTP